MDCILLERDQMCQVDGNYTWQAELVEQRTHMFFALLHQILGFGIDVVCTGTLLTVAETQALVDIGKQYNASVDVISLTTIQGVSSHDVPMAKIRDMVDRWETYPNAQ